jgi:uncharacterized protein YmfQ (DUF2313 family)
MRDKELFDNENPDQANKLFERFKEIMALPEFNLTVDTKVDNRL